MEKQSLVSIVIPVFNRQEIFTRSLQSVFAQDYPFLEIIVVDDGSKPTITVSPEFQKKIILIRQSNLGAPAARNRGFKEAHGESVIFWDADILAPTNFLSQLVKALENNPLASYAYTDHYFGWKKMPAGVFDPDRLKQNNFFATAALIRTADFPGFDEKLKRFQDWDLWLSLLEKNKTGHYVPDISYTILAGGTMSAWLPGFFYSAPFAWLPGIRSRVKRYQAAKQVIAEKHGLKP